jgi:two-component system sensor histidine kinase EvgS
MTNTASPSSPPHVPGLVLVVDDTEITRALARIQLEMLGWAVDECDSAARALDYLSGQVPQALLIDISMPGMPGDELARVVRERIGTHVRLVGHTAHCLEEQLQKLKAAGFDHILVKPASLEDMAAALPRA